MICLIDGDLIVYRVGFSTEDVDAPIALWRANMMIEDINYACNADSYQVFLTSSDKSNFRYTIDPAYKANRVQPKPRYYNELREYLCNRHNARMVFGREADDEMGINQTSSSVICSIDKDLKQIPGSHYNFVKKEHFTVSPLQGTQFFYKQILMGDSSDGIAGLHGVGPKKADKHIDPIMHEGEMWRRVLELYSLKHEDYFKRAIKAGQLLKIMTKEDEGIWQPPLS